MLWLSHFIDSAYLHHHVVEFVPWHGRLVADFGAIGVDGIGRVMKEIGDLKAIGYTQPDQRENAEFGIQHFIGLYDKLLVLQQQ